MFITHTVGSQALVLVVGVAVDAEVGVGPRLIELADELDMGFMFFPPR